MPDATLYFIECGQVRLLLPTGRGRNFLLATRETGDIFGESCLSGEGVRREAAVAAQESIIRRMPCRSFVSNARRESRLEDVIRYLVLLLAETQATIATVGSGNKPGGRAGLLPRKKGEATVSPKSKVEHRDQWGDEAKP
jgi:CRP-like cAMP-binding protein